MDTPFQTHFVKHNILSTLRISGEMTLPHVSALKTALLAALTESPALEVDLNEVKEIDSAGLQLLLFIKQEAETNHQPICLVSPSAVVTDLLKLYRLTTVFESPQMAEPEIST
jgi:anti-anti-sigma factor